MRLVFSETDTTVGMSERVAAARVGISDLRFFASAPVTSRQSTE
jgi:hypothetical protein